MIKIITCLALVISTTFYTYAVEAKPKMLKSRANTVKTEKVGDVEASSAVDSTETSSSMSGVSSAPLTQVVKPVLAPSHPNKYYVKRGDTLWGISQLFLANPWAWPEIWHNNRQVGNPHLIYPGDEISLIYMDDKPMLMVTKRSVESKVVKLSPQKRASTISSTIPTLPLDKIQGFLVSNRVVDKVTLGEAAYVLAADNRKLVMGRGDTFYARGNWSEPQIAYGLYRGGGPYIDPDTQEILGYEARDLGLARYITGEGEIATLTIARADEEIREYDKLLPTEVRKIDANFYPKTPKDNIVGKIIKVFSGVNNIGQYDVVVLNRGAREGVDKGDVFAVFRKGMVVRDKTQHYQKLEMPSEKSGLLMVFRVYNKVSLGLILKANNLLRVGDTVKRP